jgi:4-carboxymuconolactone decarboxylase
LSLIDDGDIMTANLIRRCNIARISYVTKETAPQEVADIFSKMEAHGAPVLNLWRTAAHCPTTLIHFIRMGNSLLTKTRLNTKLREIAILRVAEIMDCDYERRAHTVVAKELGVTDERLKEIKNWGSSAVFDEVERAALRFVDEVAEKGRVNDETFSNLADYLDDGMIVELAQTIGYYGMVARILLPFQVDLDEEAPTTSASIVGRPRPS